MAQKTKNASTPAGMWNIMVTAKLDGRQGRCSAALHIKDSLFRDKTFKHTYATKDLSSFRRCKHAPPSTQSWHSGIAAKQMWLCIPILTA